MRKDLAETFIPYPYSPPAMEEVVQRAADFYREMDKRRSLREFSDRPVPKEVIEQVILTASSAPSGAHKQPWTFCAVSSAEMKQQIRKAAEKEEYINYHGRMSDEWLKDLETFATDWDKPYLETAPWLIVIFRQVHGFNEDGEKEKHYYVNESVGIATGFLLAAIHQAGLVSLTHTPSPMKFLEELLGRPKHEKAYLLIPVGYPAEGARVPDIKRKGLDEMSLFFE